MNAFKETGFVTRGAMALDWRATKRSRGRIKGIGLMLTLLATDGSRGLFLVDERSPKNYLLGHVEWFDGKVAPAHGVRKKHKEKVARVRKLSRHDEILALL